MTAPNPKIPEHITTQTHLQVFPGAPSVITLAAVKLNSIESEQLANAAKFLKSSHLSILHRCKLSTQAGRRASTTIQKHSEIQFRILQQPSSSPIFVTPKQGQEQPQGSKSSREILENWQLCTADQESEGLQDLASFGGDCGVREVGKVDCDASQGTRTLSLILRPRNFFILISGNGCPCPELRPPDQNTVLCIGVAFILFHMCVYVYCHVWSVILGFGVGFKLLLGMSVLFQHQRRRYRP